MRKCRAYHREKRLILNELAMVAPTRYVGWWENPWALKFEDLQLPGSARALSEDGEEQMMQTGVSRKGFLRLSALGAAAMPGAEVEDRRLTRRHNRRTRTPVPRVGLPYPPGGGRAALTAILR